MTSHTFLNVNYISGFPSFSPSSSPLFLLPRFLFVMGFYMETLADVVKRERKNLASIFQYMSKMTSFREIFIEGEGMLCLLSNNLL